MGPTVEINYVAHVIIYTGKFRETYTMRGDTIGDLISELDEQYSGLKDLFFPPSGPYKGVFNIRTMIHLSRMGEPNVGIVDPNFKLKDGDLLMLW
jgi:molybdopterin converting factor small subunit